MAMLVLVAHSRPAVSLGDGAAQQLAEAGVTSIAIAADETTQAVVLEGWAFDPAATGEQATSALGLGPHQVLRPVLQLLLPRSSPFASAQEDRP